MTNPQSPPAGAHTPRYVVVTILDGTDKAVMSIKSRLAEHGYEVIIFQSRGTPAIEELAKAGMLVGAIDFIACEPSIIQNSKLKTQNSIHLPRLVVPVCIEFNTDDLHGVEAARTIARRLNDALSPVVVMVPTEGISRPTIEGDKFLKQFMQSLSAKVQLITIEADVNSSRFANRVADEFLRMVGGSAPAHREGSSLA